MAENKCNGRYQNNFILHSCGLKRSMRPITTRAGIQSTGRVLSLFLVVLGSSIGFAVSYGIPGTTQTKSGYDTEMGVDAICWKSQNDDEGLELPNPLVEDFVVSISGVTLLQECPMGNNISGIAPIEFSAYGERLRTTVEYNYTINLAINLTSLGATQGFTSDFGPGFIAVQVLNCLIGSSGFCSPFIHEEANARLKAAEDLAREANPTVPVKPKPPLPRGAMHGDSHVHSGYTKVNLPLSEGPVFENVQIQVPMMVLSPGTYFSLVSAQLYFYSHNSTEEEPQLWRYDMANALFGNQRLLTYQPPADVLDVQSKVLYFSYCLIALASSVILFLLVQTIKHRDHQVMKLSQARFLVVFLFFALLAAGSSFLLQPKNDFYCNASRMIVGISLQVVYAITLGRLWRIHALISPMLQRTFSNKSTAAFSRLGSVLLQGLSSWFSCCCPAKKPKKIRHEVLDNKLWIVIGALVAPQVAIQVLAVTLQPQSRTVDFNEDESTGRPKCSVESGISFGETIIAYGFMVFFLLVACLLLMALQSRKLPSLFNESKMIFDATVTSIIVLVMGLAVDLVTDEPTTSPAVNYLVAVFTVLTMTVNISLRIALPKLQMVWRGETVIVSKLVMDHTRKLRESTFSSNVGSNAYCDFDGEASTRFSVGKGNKDEFYSVKSSDVERSSANELSQTRIAGGGSNFERGDTMDNFATEDITESFNEIPPLASSEPFLVQSSPTVKRIPTPAMSMPDMSNIINRSNAGKRRLPRRQDILIEPDKEPSRSLTLKMIDMQSHLDRVTNKIMSGLAVSHEDWEETRRLAVKFGRVFGEQVGFAWDEPVTAPDGLLADAAVLVDKHELETTIREGEEEMEDASKDLNFMAEKVYL